MALPVPYHPWFNETLYHHADVGYVNSVAVDWAITSPQEFHMFDRLREEIVQYLTAHESGVLSMGSRDGAYALPVRYHSRSLEITCLLPRWSDAAYYIEQPIPILLIVPDTQGGTCWLHYMGEGIADTEASNPLLSKAGVHAYQPERYRVAKLTPRRIDLIDQRQGWGWRQTLECW